MFEATKGAAKPPSSLSGQPGNGGGISKRREWGGGEEKMSDTASGMELINLPWKATVNSLRRDILTRGIFRREIRYSFMRGR